jgi:hypothetical protein
MYICKCKREFTKKTSLISHGRFCDKYEKKPREVTKYKIKENLYKCECNDEFINHQSLNAHFSHCLIHRNNKPLLRKYSEGEMNGWNKFNENDIKEIHNKSGKTLSEKIKNGEILPSFLGKSHTDESKSKMRKSTIKYIQEAKGKCVPRYNINACIYFNKLAKEKNWNLSHAENGGEFHIKELGYFVDAYDLEKNIVVEFDESKHYNSDNILLEKDLIRQEEIINTLKCKFYRYNSKIDKLILYN